MAEKEGGKDYSNEHELASDSVEEHKGSGHNDLPNGGRQDLDITGKFRLLTGQKIYTVLGDIKELHADVLVIGADPKLKHKDGLPRAIVDKGGRAIREKCRQHIRKNGPLSEGEIYVTSAGNLQAKIVIHAVSPVWKGGHNYEEEILREIIWQCLETAAEQDFNSIATPALGAGFNQCPVKLSTQVIAKTIRDFFQEKGCSISMVFLCDTNPEAVRCFKESLEISIGN